MTHPIPREGSAVSLWRLPLLMAAILALLAAVWAGWLRLGWQLPDLQPSLAGVHGPLMVSGFLGTLISLERAVALRRRWPFLGPAFSAAGAVLLIAGLKSPIPGLLLAAGSVWLVLIYGFILRSHLAFYTLVMSAGALAWAMGNAFWLAGYPVYRVVLWWAGFLILTIVGERLELSRLANHNKRVMTLSAVGICLFMVGLLASIFWPDGGLRLASLAMVGTSAWLARYDIARSTIRKAGLPRYAAVCLLSGYAWLFAAGVIGLYFGPAPAGFIYDAFLHTIFIGFVFAMIFAHAPMIFPAMLGIPIQFQNIFYLPLLLLHLSLLLRISGDLVFNLTLRMWGGLLNGVTLLVFLIFTARSILVGIRERKAAR